MKSWNKNKKTLLIMLIVVVTIIVGFIIIKKVRDRNINSNNGNDKTVEVAKKELNLDSDIVMNTYGIFDVMNNSLDCVHNSDCNPSLDCIPKNDVSSNFKYFAYFFGKDKINESDISSNIKAYIALSKMYGFKTSLQQEIKSVSGKKLRDEVKKIFGQSASFDNNLDAMINGNYYNYDSKKDLYTLNEAGNIAVGKTELVRKPISAYQVDDVIEVNEKVALIECYPVEEVKEVGALKVHGINNRIIEQKEISSCNNYESSFNIENYYDKLDTYKWTFTKDINGDYIFTSVERN